MGNKTNNCKFCSIIQDKMELIYEDDIIVLFHDIKPEAKIHIQSVPKIHIDNINHLTKNDIKLLKHMKEKSAEFIKKIYGESAEIKMGFHIPPFYSIGHLHMHCVIPPFNSNLKKLILFKWIFMPIDSMIEKLSSK